MSELQSLAASCLPAFMGYAQTSVSAGVVLQQFQQQQPLHAYLITGARGLGKRTFANVLASALFCTAEQKPCGRCAACRRVWGDNEPDVIRLFSDDGSQIGVDAVRDVVQKVGQHAFGTGFRVVLIEPVEKMTPQAQNCLLKSLEEPVANVVFLLMTHELSATLGTIASRCLRVKLLPWDDRILQRTLMTLGHDAISVKAVLPRCGGNVGTAISMLEESKSGSEAHSFAMEALKIASDAAAVSLSTRLKEDRGNADAYLLAVEQTIHQALLVRTGQLDADALSSYPPLWKRAAEAAPVSDLNALLTVVMETRRRKANQVNWQSNIDHLMMKLLEEHQKWQQLLA